MFFATELEDGARNLAEERQAHQATRRRPRKRRLPGRRSSATVDASAQDALKELAMERDVHVRTKKALDAEQAAHAATRTGRSCESRE